MGSSLSRFGWIRAIAGYRPFTPELLWFRRYRGIVDSLGSKASWFRLLWFVGLMCYVDPSVSSYGLLA